VARCGFILNFGTSWRRSLCQSPVVDSVITQAHYTVAGWMVILLVTLRVSRLGHHRNLGGGMWHLTFCWYSDHRMLLRRRCNTLRSCTTGRVCQPLTGMMGSNFDENVVSRAAILLQCTIARQSHVAALCTNSPADGGYGYIAATLPWNACDTREQWQHQQPADPKHFQMHSHVVVHLIAIWIGFGLARQVCWLWWCGICH